MFDELVALSPAHFFSISAPCLYFDGKKEDPLPNKYVLPDLSMFYTESPFAKVALGWNMKGIFCTLRADIALSMSYFPDYRKGDSIELFFDTRDMKKSGYPTRFCHHFCFLPEPQERDGEVLQGIEVSRFRAEESHELADPSLFFIKTHKERKSYLTHIFIPHVALHGYDPAEFERMGFSYRVNRFKGPPQYFSAPGDEIAIESHPSLWASLKLEKENRPLA